jgi:hypothetical protein
MAFRNSVVSGTVLVRTAVQSIDYVAGVSGWVITRAGSVEFTNGVFRGSVSAGGGNVLLNAGGLAIDGPTTQYDINGIAGFLAQNLPVDGQQMQMTPGGLFLTPQDPSPLGVAVDFAAITVGYFNSGLANEQPVLIIGGVEYTGKSAPFMNIIGQAANDANPDSSTDVQVVANQIDFFVGATLPSYARGEYGSFLLSFGPASSANIAVTYGKTYTSAPMPYANIDSGAGATSLCVTRCTARTSTGFNIFIFVTDGTNRTFVNVPISWFTIDQL